MKLKLTFAYDISVIGFEIISYKMWYLQNEARKQISVKEVTLQFSMIFQIRQENNTIDQFFSHMPFNYT
jgi:hypothetical protein